MKFNWIIDFKWNELDVKLTIDVVIGIIMFFCGVFYDVIANAFTLRHNSTSLPILQIIWCAFWAIYITWTMFYLQHYGE